MTRQMTLGLVLRDDATFDNFYPGDNLALLAQLQSFSTGEGEPCLYLWGASGGGRTHLLQACCHAASRGIYLDLAECGLQPALLVDMEYFPFVFIDNIDAIMGDPAWELALFNFYNRSRAQGARLLMAGSAAPSQLGCRLPDLSSRLSGGLALNLQPLTDDQKLNALKMRAKRRGLELSVDVGNFLLSHYSRSMNHLFFALETLDQEAMAAKRRLTIPFTKEVLGI